MPATIQWLFDQWQPQLSADTPERQAIRTALEAELAGRGTTGMRPLVRGGTLVFRHTWVIVIARRRARQY